MNYSLQSIALTCLVGIAGIGVGMLWNGKSETPDTPAEEQPLYWVAPMDANYRRDGPGKSPMGMDLVPVYAGQQEAGLVEIAPEVVNNLGVRTAAAQFKPLEQRIRTVGYVKYNEDRLIHIHPRVEGWIEKLYVKASGDPVNQGQPLYDLYSPELVNAQEELILAMRRNNERLLKAAEDRLRALQLGEVFIASLKREQKIRQTVTFNSPQKGVVDNLNIREGFFVGPDTTLMSIGTLEEVWVEAQLFESQGPLVEIGQAVSMRLDHLPGREWLGQVEYIYPSLEAATRTLRVRLRFDNQDGLLRPNMFAQVAITTTDSEPVVVIPRQALIRTGEQDRVVLALDEGRYKSVAVVAGASTSEEVAILSGLKRGEQVVTSAQFLLDSESSKTADFQRMEPRSDNPHHGMHEGHHHD